MKSSRIMVTGGCGFIGSNFVHYCLNNSKNTRIMNVDDMLKGSNKLNLSAVDNNRYTFKQLNTTSPKIAAIVQGSDIVVNFAAESHVDRSIKNPKSFLRNNVQATFNLLENIRKYDKTLIHISTDEIYGTALGNVSFKETDRLAPSNPYSASKAAADLYVQAYTHTYGIRASILRCTNNFGPYQFPEKFIPKTIIRALANMSIPLYGSGNQERDWTYVTDFCSAIFAVLKSNLRGRIYNVSSYNIKRNVDVARKVLSILGKPESLIKSVQDRPAHDTRYNIDSSSIRSELGWKPQFQFDDALEKTVQWYINNNKWWRVVVNKRVLSEAPWK